MTPPPTGSGTPRRRNKLGLQPRPPPSLPPDLCQMLQRLSRAAGQVESERAGRALTTLSELVVLPSPVALTSCGVEAHLNVPPPIEGLPCCIEGGTRPTFLLLGSRMRPFRPSPRPACSARVPAPCPLLALRLNVALAAASAPGSLGSAVSTLFQLPRISHVWGGLVRAS